MTTEQTTPSETPGETPGDAPRRRGGVSGRQLAVLAVLVPAVLIGGFALGRALRDEPTRSELSIVSADGETRFEHEYVIPAGTGARIADGELVEIVPAELAVRVGESIRIVNDDSDDHIVGVFFVAAGETLTQTFNSPAVLSGECSVHPSGAFTLRIEA